MIIKDYNIMKNQLGIMYIMVEVHNTTCEVVLLNSNSNDTRIWPGL